MPEITWDYTDLASSYHKRAPYSPRLIEKVVKKAELHEKSVVCDMGAGTGFLSREFAKKGVSVNAIEPNQQMREQGQLQCGHWPHINWFKGAAENSQQPDNSADLISFGSSFNVVDKELALRESLRVCKSGGWFLAVWNHRDLTQGLQAQIEGYINSKIVDYRYGTRRQDHTDYLIETGLFSEVKVYKEEFLFKQTQDDVIQAWYSHATLQRQAGPKYIDILKGIENIIRKQTNAIITTPFYSQAWLAQFK